jgi:hypothetical protein
MTPEEFAAFAEPGWGRIAAGFSLLPYGTARTLVSYEARTAIPARHAGSLATGRWYGPSCDTSCEQTLTTIRHDAERAAG